MTGERHDRIPDTLLFDRKRALRGYRINKMAMGLVNPLNREAFKKDEEAYLDRFGLSAQETGAGMIVMENKVAAPNTAAA